MTSEELYKNCQELVEQGEFATVTAEETMADELAPNTVVIKKIKVKLTEGYIELQVTTPEARPPFEWLAEITWDTGEYCHYLVRKEGIFAARGKELTPVTPIQLESILQHLRLT